MTEVIHAKTLDELNNALSGDEVVVDFQALDWCVPCQRFEPQFELAAENSDAIFVAVDVDEVPGVVEEYEVRGVPTVRLYRHGNFIRDLRSRTARELLEEIKD